MSLSRTVLITGGTAGLGFSCAREIARSYPKYNIIIASRTDPDSAANKINNLLKQKNVQFLPLDLSNQSKVRAFVKDYEAHNFPPLSILLLNAGLQFPYGIKLTEDGIESTFGINHVGHALLFHLLVPHLAEDNVRVVLTSSGTHDPAQKTGYPDAEFTSAEQLAHPLPEEEKVDGRKRYGNSKMANIMWGYALARRFAKVKGRNLTVVLFDPGLMPGTGLAREFAAPLRWIWVHVLPKILPVMRFFLFENIHTTAESGANLAWVATSKDVGAESGVYFEGRKIIKSSVESYDVKKQDELWDWTIKNVAVNEEEIAKFQKGIASV